MSKIACVTLAAGLVVMGCVVEPGSEHGTGGSAHTTQPPPADTSSSSSSSGGGAPPASDASSSSSSGGAPSAGSSSSSSSSGGGAASAATYDGCTIFPPGDVYNQDVTGVAPDPHSAEYIKSVTDAGDTGAFYASTGVELVNLADASTPKLTVHQKVAYHTFPAPVPWLSSFYIEPLSDGHAIVLDTSACHLYELYNTTYSGGVLSAYSGADWDLSKPFLTHSFAPSAMASGLSLFAGMVKYEEVSGGIHHALNIALQAHTPCNCSTLPADDTDGLAYAGPGTSYELPYGAHLRLSASFDDSSFGPQAKAISEALKHYGAYVADTGGSENAIYTANPKNGSWNASDLAALGKIHVSDFEVLPVGPTKVP